MNKWLKRLRQTNFLEEVNAFFFYDFCFNAGFFFDSAETTKPVASLFYLHQCHNYCLYGKRFILISFYLCLEMLPFKKLFTFRLILIFLALHIFNCSIDAPDAFPNYVPEDLSINEMESVGELMLEKVFGFTTALPEHDENDQEEGMDFKLSKLMIFYQPIIKPVWVSRKYNLVCNYPVFEGRFETQFISEIESPPPQA